MVTLLLSKQSYANVWIVEYSQLRNAKLTVEGYSESNYFPLSIYDE